MIYAIVLYVEAAIVIKNRLVSGIVHVLSALLGPESRIRSKLSITTLEFHFLVKEYFW